MVCNSEVILARDKAAPDAELLEFIGEGVPVGNDVVDPVSWQAMQDMTAKQQQKNRHDTQSADKSGQQGRQQGHE